MRKPGIRHTCVIVGILAIALVSGVQAGDKGSTSVLPAAKTSTSGAIATTPSRTEEAHRATAESSIPGSSSAAESSPRLTGISVAREISTGGSIVESVDAPVPNAYEVNWQCVNAGGVAALSASYGADVSLGQAVSGYATSTSYEIGAGYWYGATVIVDGCSCPYQCDYDMNHALDALDLNSLIDALFFGGPNPQDPECPTTRGDFDNSGAPDALDLNDLIDHLFFGGGGPNDPCL